jgi:hypothetical protein
MSKEQIIIESIKIILAIAAAAFTSLSFFEKANTSKESNLILTARN